MEFVKVSRVNKSIEIHSSYEVYIDHVESSLSMIAKGRNGRALLDEIEKYGVNGKHIKIFINHHDDNSTIPILTSAQAAKYSLPDDISCDENQMKAMTLAQKGWFGFSGQGSSAKIRHHPEQTINVDKAGIPKRGYNRYLAFISLSHELAHALHMMNGTLLTSDKFDFSDPSNPNTQEEDRAIGIGKFKDEKLSENGIREDHGIPLRSQYYLR